MGRAHEPGATRQAGKNRLVTDVTPTQHAKIAR